LSVVKVIPVVIADIHVVAGIPVLRPVLRPRVYHHEGIAAVLEAGVTPNDEGLAVNPKPMTLAEIETEAIFRNEVAAIAAALIPSAVIALPI